MEMMNIEFVAEIRPPIAESRLECGARMRACYLGLGIPKLAGVLLASNDRYNSLVPPKSLLRGL